MLMDFIEANWLLILLVLAVAALIAWYIFHAARRTRVTGDRRDVLDEGAKRASRNQALIDAPTAAAPQVQIPPATPAGLAGIGEAVEAAVEHQQIHAAQAAAGADDLTRMKGVGPKLAAQLHQLGVIRFAQIADWDDADIDRIDAQLGRFQGRIRRDGWVEQARLLAAGDTAGFASRFGAIS
jgi:predicted flap endonuclease-1-like 5' DNA nuclease